MSDRLQRPTLRFLIANNQRIADVKFFILKTIKGKINFLMKLAFLK